MEITCPLPLLCLLRALQLFVLSRRLWEPVRSDLINEACEWGRPQFLTR